MFSHRKKTFMTQAMRFLLPKGRKKNFKNPEKLKVLSKKEVYYKPDKLYCSVYNAIFILS